MNFRNIVTIIILGITVVASGMLWMVSMLTKTNSVLGNLITILLMVFVAVTLVLLVQQL